MNYQVIDYSPTRYLLQVCICCRSPALVRYKLKPTVLEAEVMKVEGLSGAFGAGGGFWAGATFKIQSSEGRVSEAE